MNIPLLPYSQPGVRLFYKVFNDLTQVDQYVPYIPSRTYNIPNPIGLNYPKTPYLRGSHYSNYARVKSHKENYDLRPNSKKDVNMELTKVLQKEIAELHTLTEQAKKIAEKKKKVEEAQKINY